jgi:stage V sporulation protein B
MNLVDAAIVPQRLQVAGFEGELGIELFGQLSGMAMVLVNFPTIITISLAASLVPSISEAFALKNDKLIKKRTESALRLTILIGLPASVGLFTLAKPLTTVIFNNSQAAIPLRFVSWGVLFITLQLTTAAILQGLGKTSIPARNLFIGAIINGVINFTLTALPQFGIRGAALGTVTGFAIAAILNLIYVKLTTNFRLKYKVLILKPSLAGFLMGIIVKSGFSLRFKVIELLPDYGYMISVFAIVLIAILSYILILLLLKEIKYSDLILIPKIGKKLADSMQKLGLVGDK